MTSPVASHDELRELLGDSIDDVALERIASSGACFDEVAEALAMFEAEQVGDRLPDATSSKVLSVRAVLEDSLESDDDLARDAYVGSMTDGQI